MRIFKQSRRTSAKLPSPGQPAASSSDVATVDPKSLIFVGGLHRSGTTPLGRILAEHPQISGFHATGVEEDEGQHLQRTYATAERYGGPGRFARHPDAHLISAPGDPGAERQALLAAWVPYWDLSKPYLVEKSPPNLIRGRYLQEVFPGSALVVIIRHPVIVALSTKKWARLHSVERLVEHWFAAHDTLRQDVGHLARVHVLHYERMGIDPVGCLADLSTFLRLETPLDAGLWQSSRSSTYLDRWEAMAAGLPHQRWQRGRIVRRFAERARDYGYEIEDPSVAPSEDALNW